MSNVPLSNAHQQMLQNCVRMKGGFMVGGRMRWFTANLIFAIIFLPDCARSADDESFRQLEARDFKIMSPIECARGYHEAPSTGKQKDTRRWDWPFEWVPSGARRHTVRPECAADTLESLVLATRDNGAAQSDAIVRFFNNCSGELAHEAPAKSLVLLKLLLTRYRFCEHPRIRKFIIHLDDGNFIRGILALKAGSLRRPLVIVRAGMFGDVGDNSHRFQLMHFFDESPFNVLALASTSGADFPRDNRHLAAGGFDEGMQIMRVARWLRTSPLEKLISSIHIAGASMGGHGVLYASYMNPFNPDSQQKPIIASALAMCPVVELRASMLDLFDGGMRGRMARWATRRSLRTVLKSVPMLSQFFPNLNSATVSELPEMVIDGAVDYYKGRDESWALPPFNGRRISNKSEFWDLNSFTKLAEQPLATPTIAIAAQDDRILETTHNSGALAERASRASENQLHVVTVPRGNHCAFGIVYGWDTLSALARSFILSHSPELMARARIETAPLPAERISAWIHIGEKERHLSQELRADSRKDEFRLGFKIWNDQANDGACADESMYGSDSSCIRVVWTRIPWSAIDAAWAKAPQNNVEAEALTRWMNTNLRVVDIDDQILHGRQTRPTKFRWVNYD